MIDIKTMDMGWPYGGLVTIFLEHIEFNFEGEEANKKYTRIGNSTLNQMGIDIKEDFDFKIPITNPFEALLKKMMKRHKNDDKKMNVIG